MATPPAPNIDEGVRWAVLSAFARSLAPSSHRTVIRLLALGLRPRVGQQGVALVAAADLGHIRCGRITMQGLTVAGGYLADVREKHV